jgi:hypothetical protein
VQVEHGSVFGVGGVEPAPSGEEPAPRDTEFMHRKKGKVSDLWMKKTIRKIKHEPLKGFFSDP